MSPTIEWRHELGLSVRRAAIWLAVYFVSFGSFAFFASLYCDGRGLMATLVFVECAVLAAVIALFAAKSDPRQLGIRRFILRLSVFCVSALLLSSAVLTAAWAVWGAEPLVGGLAAQLVILSFCLLLGAIFALARCGGTEPLFAQCVCWFVACVLMGTVFYADPIVEAQPSPKARSVAIRAALAVNPITAISWSLLEYDLMRRQIMYDRISVIGRWYRTPYPQWWATACGYVALSVVILAGAGLLRRRSVLNTSRTERG